MSTRSPVKTWGIALVLAAATSASCASVQTPAHAKFAAQVKGTGGIHLTGWLRLRGEAMIFSSQKAMEAKLRFPECISGVMKDQASQDLSRFDGMKVIVSGQLFSFASLVDEDAPLLQRKVLSASVIPNFCFGENVLLIKEIRIAK
jgi:hypothetical protein